MAERKSFLIRIDAQTLDLVKEWADDEFRSLNGQVEYLLREALKRAGRLPGPAARVGKPGGEPE
ncbi:MAG: Arc family DNA-binding protein [Bryobacterales bacterium]|nr:Arc family DNA-binding protein [Bryobacterales bacterium]